MYRLNDKTLLIAALALNFVLQFLALMFVDTMPIADSVYYIRLAEDLYTNGSYINSNGYPTCFWPVGLPAYLTLLKYITNDYIFLSKLTNIILSSFLILLLFKTFQDELSKKEKIIFLFSFLLFFNNLFSSNILLTDYPFTFFLWLGIFILIKYDHSIIYLFLIGAIIGLMSYLRPIGLLLPFVFFIYWRKNCGLKKALQKSIIVVAMMFFVLSPWIYRNYTLFHKFIPVSCNGGYNFLMGNHKFSSGGLNFNFNYDFDIANEPEEEQKAYIKAFEDILNQPFSALFRLPKKFLYSYLRGDSSVTWALKKTKINIPPILLSVIFFTTNFSFYLVILLGILSVAKKKHFIDFRLKQIFRLIYLFIIILIFIFVGGERYIIPLLPIHFFFFSKFFS